MAFVLLIITAQCFLSSIVSSSKRLSLTTFYILSVPYVYLLCNSVFFSIVPLNCNGIKESLKICSRSYCLSSLSGCCPIKSRCLFCHSLSFLVYFFWLSVSSELLFRSCIYTEDKKYILLVHLRNAILSLPKFSEGVL